MVQRATSTWLQPVVGMAADPSTGGYWLVAADGGVFAYNAPFFGSMGGVPLNQPVVGMAATADGGGYWLVARDGGVFSFGDAAYRGSALSDASSVPAVAISGSGSDDGYRVAFGQSEDPFGASVASFLSQREGNVTAALYDAGSGATFQLNPGELQYTASIVKVDIMATALQEAQESGQAIPSAELALMPPMIEESDNDAATDMWNDVGGPASRRAVRQKSWNDVNDPGHGLGTHHDQCGGSGAPRQCICLSQCGAVRSVAGIWAVSDGERGTGPGLGGQRRGSCRGHGGVEERLAPSVGRRLADKQHRVHFWSRTKLRVGGPDRWQPYRGLWDRHH